MWQGCHFPSSGMNMTKTRPQKRSVGRPGAGSGDKQADIIEATLSILRTTHPDAVTVIEVARHAGVDPAMVRYYFTNKEGLFVAAAKTLMGRLLARATDIVQGEGGLGPKIQERLKGMLAILVENPFLHTLLNRVYSSESAEGRQLMADVNGRSMVLMGDLLRARPGDPVRGVDPRILQCALIGLSEVLLNARPLIEYMFGVEADSRDFVDRYAAAMADLLLHGLAPG